MEIEQLKDLWKSCDSKLDRVIAINHQTLKELKLKKANDNLLMFKVLTWAGLLSAIAWVIFLGWFTFELRYFSGFVISASGILLIAVIGIINYMRQLQLIHTFNYNEGIANAQEKLASLELSLLTNIRIMFLQAPFYSTFYLTENLLRNASPFWLIIQILVTGGLTAYSIWFYRSVSVENRNKPWVQKMLDSFGLRTLRKAMIQLNEIEEFKKG